MKYIRLPLGFNDFRMQPKEMAYHINVSILVKLIIYQSVFVVCTRLYAGGNKLKDWSTAHATCQAYAIHYNKHNDENICRVNDSTNWRLISVQTLLGPQTSMSSTMASPSRGAGWYQWLKFANGYMHTVPPSTHWIITLQQFQSTLSLSWNSNSCNKYMAYHHPILSALSWVLRDGWWLMTLIAINSD